MTSPGQEDTLVYQSFDPDEHEKSVAAAAQRRFIKVYALCFSPNGALLAAGYSNGIVAVWSISNAVRGYPNSLQPLGSIKACKGPIYSVQLSEDMVICGCDDGLLSYRLDHILSKDRTTDTLEPTFTWQASTHAQFEVNGIARHGNTLYLACGDAKGYAFDMATGTVLRQYVGHEDYLHCIARRQCGQVVTGSEDGTVKLWDEQSGQCLSTIIPPPLIGNIANTAGGTQRSANSSGTEHKKLAPPPPPTGAAAPSTGGGGRKGAGAGGSSPAPSLTAPSGKGLGIPSEKAQGRSGGRTGAAKGSKDLQVVGKQWVPSLHVDDTDTWMAIGGPQGPMLYHLPTQQMTFQAKTTYGFVARSVVIAGDEICVAPNHRMGMYHWTLQGEPLPHVPLSSSTQYAVAVSPGNVKVIAIGGEGPAVDILIDHGFKSFSLSPF